jgi:outer membrane receptor protein involved in Fe transport
MSSNRLVRASVAALVGAAFSCAGGAWAQGAPNAAADSELDEVTVTGSRVITENVRSPTPIASLDAEEAALTTPSDIADALNKLPEILAGASGGATPRSQGNGATNNGNNVLALRAFGASRTLVMLDGHRMVPSNQNGTVNVDVLPQMLVQRVDIVTGGASAVYGSDAVAGVINYVLDKNFTGLKLEANAGISKYGDGEQGEFGVAWGTSLFDGRGHFETSARYREQARIPIADRPYGKNGQAWLLTGNGSATNPWRETPYGRRINEATNGNVNCGTACTVNGYTFNAPGVLTPLVHGTPTGQANIESGGDGSYIKDGTFRSGISMKDWFGRFSYDVTDDVNAYVQASFAQASNLSNWVNATVSASGSRPNTLFANNPFLPAATQAQLGAGITCGTPGAAGWRCLPASPPVAANGTRPPTAVPTTPYFSAPSYTWQNLDGQPAGPRGLIYQTDARDRSRTIEAGLTGTLGEFTWDAFYSFGETINKVSNPHNTDNAKYLAALDAVIAPPGTTVNGVNVAGSIVCWVTTQAQYRDLYPGCVPLNITNPGGPSQSAFNYLHSETFWALEQHLHNVGGSIGGGLFGIGLPAGEIRANLSFDARWSTYDMISNASPTETVNCTGLRMCLANGLPNRWVQNTNAPVSAKNDVVEAALEVNVPLLVDLPFAQDVSTNLAGRYTKYSSFSSVETWKAGLNWQVDDNVRFRATYSRDIRAPNLNDLFAPASAGNTTFNDLLTGVSNNTIQSSQGNPLLTPEKARTLTAGVVLTPTIAPSLNFSVDYFRIRMTDAITTLTYGGAVQDLCMASAPAFDSPFCQLAIRPITDPTNAGYRLPSNFPSRILSAGVNASRTWTHGYDFQLNYGFDLASLVSSASGRVSFRHMASYQPPVKTITQLTASSTPTWGVTPKLRQTTFLTYRNEDWTVALQYQWLGKVDLRTAAQTATAQNFVNPKLRSYKVLDTTISKQINWDSGGKTDVYLTVNNVFNERAPLFAPNNGLPNLVYPTLGFHDDMGRYFTAGVRILF